MNQKSKHYGLWIICALLAMLIFCAGTAMAEEIHSAQVELFSEGKFPQAQPDVIQPRAANDFNEYMLEKLNKQAKSIDVASFKLKPDEFYNAYQALLNSHPEMFFVSGGYSYYSGKYVTSILPKYNYSGQELKNMQAIYEEGVSKVVSYARSAKTTVGRLLRANDYLCANFEYDTSYKIYSPELFFKNSKGVCQAYMLVYRAVLNEFGISNIAVTSQAMNHTWNMVYLDGSWYHIDVTWNDPISDVPLRATHNHFLLSDAGIKNSGHYSWNDGWESFEIASNKKYDNFFWKNLNQVAAMQGDVVYFVDSDYTSVNRDVYAYNLANNTSKKIYSFSYGYGSYYRDYNPVWLAGNTLYYAVRNSLYGMPLSGGQATLVYDTGNTNQWIWYPVQSGSQLKMYVASSPYASGSIRSFTMDIPVSLTLSPSLLEMEPNTKVRLNVNLDPSDLDRSNIRWGTSNAVVATISQNGEVTAVGAGAAVITAMYENKATAKCTVIVTPKDKLYLPANTKTIESEAFANISTAMIVVPDGVSSIGSKAFANNMNLRLVQLPAGNISIAKDAFSGSNYVTLICVDGSSAHQYAIANNISYVTVSEYLLKEMIRSGVISFPSANFPFADYYVISL